MSAWALLGAFCQRVAETLRRMVSRLVQEESLSAQELKAQNARD